MSFFLNMLENDNSNLQTKFRVHTTSIIFFNNQIRRSRDCTNLPDLPTLEAYPTSGVGRRLDFFL